MSKKAGAENQKIQHPSKAKAAVDMSNAGKRRAENDTTTVPM
jgi:hypothetical protein